jgi:hypothetical protein
MISEAERTAAAIHGRCETTLAGELAVLARAHLWDPYWARHAAYELGWKIPWVDPCDSLNKYTPRFK